MSFMERLREFTQNTLEKRERMREKSIIAERIVNEEKLMHKGHLANHKSEIPECLPAEFMPMPGSINNKKNEKLTEKGISSPWGGKFKLSPGKPGKEV
jgi:hypothetical protein